MFKTLVYGNEQYKDFEIDENGVIRNNKTNHVYKNSISKNGGYLVVYLPMGKRGKVKCIRVHKAVAETFIPNPNNYPVVNHIDENKLNPSVDNLEWTTYKGNIQSHWKKCSENEQFFNNRKLTYKEVKIIRGLKGLVGTRKLAELFEVSRITIHNVQNNTFYSEGY